MKLIESCFLVLTSLVDPYINKLKYSCKFFSDLAKDLDVVNELFGYKHIELQLVSKNECLFSHQS